MKKTSNPICPMCEKGKLTESTYTGRFKHGNKTIQVKGLQCCFCDLCGADPVLTEQMIYNQIKVADEKRKRLGLLTSAEVKDIREKLGLTQKRAAKIFGGGEKAFSKYERGDALQSEAMDKLLRVAANFSDVFSALANGIGKTINVQEIPEVLPELVISFSESDYSAPVATQPTPIKYSHPLAMKMVSLTRTNNWVELSSAA